MCACIGVVCGTMQPKERFERGDNRSLSNVLNGKTSSLVPKRTTWGRGGLRWRPANLRPTVYKTDENLGNTLKERINSKILDITCSPYSQPNKG